MRRRKSVTDWPTQSQLLRAGTKACSQEYALLLSLGVACMASVAFDWPDDPRKWKA
jgi:hypothetical protein